MSGHGFTAEQIEAGIISALKAGDMESVTSLLHLLAPVDPDHAQIITDAILIMGGTK